ncbi:hypothetical protein KKA09_00330 [Patescibacteria group bacterium]|nr:hypothetical protein [Patescibacteria group bacterium]
MKFEIKGPFKENTYNAMRRAGYVCLVENKDTGEANYVRALAVGGYPRFHIYLKMENETLIFNLHLDQKRPVYKGTTAHSGDYDGEVIEKEVERIKKMIA